MPNECHQINVFNEQFFILDKVRKVRFEQY